VVDVSDVYCTSTRARRKLASRIVAPPAESGVEMRTGGANVVSGISANQI
jgi:hypothetical protein